MVESVDRRHFFFRTHKPVVGERETLIPLYTRPLQQPLTRSQIREIFLANNFTIKSGLSDLKEYVYQAARALECAHGITGETK